VSNVESRAASQAVRHELQGGASTGGGSNAPGSRWAGDPALARTVERELVPRLLLAHRVGAFPPLGVVYGPRTGILVSADDLLRFMDEVLGADDEAVGRFVEQLMARGVTIEAVCIDLLAPTARQLGEMWETDERDFFEVTVGLGRVHRAMREAVTQAAAPAIQPTPAGLALVSSLPGEQHTLGCAMVAEFFVRDGWSVQVGAPSSEEELSSLVRAGWLDVVGFSVATEDRLLTLRRMIATARRLSQNPHLVVIVGGRVFTEHPELADRVGADGYTVTGTDAPAIARDLIRRPPG
jgi:methanogenic corrinoid protein MtbC1